MVDRSLVRSTKFQKNNMCQLRYVFFSKKQSDEYVNMCLKWIKNNASLKRSYKFQKGSYRYDE